MFRSRTDPLLFLLIVATGAATAVTASSSWLPFASLALFKCDAAFVTWSPPKHSSRRSFTKEVKSTRAFQRDGVPIHCGSGGVRTTAVHPAGARLCYRKDGIVSLRAANGSDDSTTKPNGDDNQSIGRGDVIFSKVDLPDLKIYRAVAYDVTSIYQQGVDENTGRIVKIQVESFNEPLPTGFDWYATLYNPKYHDKNDFGFLPEGAEKRDGGTSKGLGVVVKPEELGLVGGGGWNSVQDEFRESAWLALPGFFWIFLVVVMTNLYTDRYGGNFIDALMGPKYR